MPKGKPERGLDEQQLEGGGGGAGMSSIKQFEKTSPTADRAQAKIAKGNVGADEVLKNLRNKFNVSKESFNAKRDIRDPSIVSEEERARALGQYRRDQALKGASEEGGVKKLPYIEPTEKKKGGLTASRRADGIASRGKTKGRFV
jgi:hypothetical protein